MLVLSRAPGERVLLSDGIVVTLVEIRGGKARLGFEAPSDINIVREECGPAKNTGNAKEDIDAP